MLTLTDKITLACIIIMGMLFTFGSVPPEGLPVAVQALQGAAYNMAGIALIVALVGFVVMCSNVLE